MICNKQLKLFFVFLHYIGIIVAVLGVFYQAYQVYYDMSLSMILSISFILRYCFRLPNQICVSYDSPNGWLSVYETIVSLIGFMILAYVTYLKKKESEIENNLVQNKTTLSG